MSLAPTTRLPAALPAVNVAGAEGVVVVEPVATTMVEFPVGKGATTAEVVGAAAVVGTEVTDAADVVGAADVAGAVVEVEEVEEVEEVDEDVVDGAAVDEAEVEEVAAEPSSSAAGPCELMGALGEIVPLFAHSTALM